MSPLIKKEIRLLMPAWIGGIALAVLPFCIAFIWPETINYSSLMWLPVLGGLFLSLSSFGSEFNDRTFPLMMAQPISRQRLWATKLAVLLAALLSIVFTLVVLAEIKRFSAGRKFFIPPIEPIAISLFVVFVILCSAHWTVLLLRQLAGAFWFTVLVPGVMLLILAGLFADHSEEFNIGMVVSVFGSYSLIVFFFARWLFFRAQDWQWSGGTIEMPEWRGAEKLKVVFARAAWHPRTALWRKEVQLHQAQFVMAFALLLLHLVVLVTRHFGHFRKNSTTEFILETFWTLWLVMPVLVGCAAIAEERKLGTLASELCQPLKWWTKFRIKFSVVLCLSLLFGLFVPLLLEGAKISPDFHYPALQILFVVFCPVEIGTIAFYISSLSRNTLQALAPAIFAIVGLNILISFGTNLDRFDLGFLWSGYLHWVIAVPILFLAFLALAFGNFKRIEVGKKLICQNVLAFAMALLLGITATSAVYHRFWEKFTPFEPPHGAAKLTQTNPATFLNELSHWQSGVTIRLADGRIWQAKFVQYNFDPVAFLTGNVKAALTNAEFFSGSNWLTIRDNGRDFVGIKTDGTLWISENPGRLIKLENGGEGGWDESKAKHLIQFGSETNWSSVEMYAARAFLIKTDGTLWCWSAKNGYRESRTNWPGLRTLTPRRLGKESDWNKVFKESYRLCFQKSDGTVWIWGDKWQTNGKALLEIQPRMILVQDVPRPATYQFRSTIQISHGLQYKVGIADNGTFRIWVDMHLYHPTNSHFGYYQWTSTDLQIGKETNWLAVAGAGGKVVTLKNDGTLWLWNFQRNHPWSKPNDGVLFEPEVLRTSPIQLGSHSDWIAISGDWEDVTALAADGSLWFWPLENYTEYVGPDNVRIQPLLDVSRKPIYLGNIFEGATAKE